MHGQPSSMSGSAWGSDQEGGNQMDDIQSWINMYDQIQGTQPPQPTQPTQEQQFNDDGTPLRQPTRRGRRR